MRLEIIMFMTATFIIPCPFCRAAAARPCVNPITRLDLGFPHLERTRVS